MKTQGISLVSAGMSTNVTSKGAKTTDGSFDSFMDNQAAKTDFRKQAESIQAPEKKPVGTQEERISLKTESKTELGNSSEGENVSGQSMTEQKVMTSSEPEKMPVEEVDVSAVEKQVIALMAQIFGMSEEEITHVLEQNGIDPSLFLFQVQPDDTISIVNQDALQQMIMDVHGITDRGAFLVNDLLSTELTQLTAGIKEVMAALFGVEPEELARIEQSLMLGFAERIATETGNGEAIVAEPGYHAMAQQINPGEKADLSAAGQGKADVTESMQVIVEDYKTVGNVESQMQGSMDNSGSESAMTGSEVPNAGAKSTVLENPDSAAASLFTDRLSQAFAEVAKESVAGPETVMRQIVEQVVRQVKIRVLPETTSMELQLNPESLGKVGLHVSSTGGVATATMVVENQVAKEALESQMVTLKQSFAEQGLKVDAVEVTVSEFGLNQNSDQTKDQQQSAGGKRTFREDAGMENTEETNESAVMTAQERRDSNSVVDYTA